MKKIVIGSHNVAEYIGVAETTFLVESHMILTPSAEDILIAKEIDIIYKDELGVGGLPSSTPLVAKVQDQDSLVDSSSLVKTVVRILQDDFNISDGEKISEISVLVMEKLNKLST